MNSWRWHLACFLRRFPWMTDLALRGMRVFQPRVTMGVIGVLMDETRTQVFLVEHVFHARKPWGLPGGWMERGEEPTQTVEREFYEETSLRVRAVHPLLIRRGIIGAHMDVVYLCEADGLDHDIHLCGELLRWAWVPVDDLPPIADFHQRAIQRAGEFYAHGTLPNGEG